MIVGLIGLAVLFVLVLLRVPIGVALFVVGFTGVWVLSGFNLANSVAFLAPLSGLNGDIAALPLFILVGSFAVASGVATDAYSAARKWLGRLPGGIGLATIAASSTFASVSGSSIASAVAMGKLSIPEMRKVGYDGSFIAGIVGSGGLLAVLIPPSGLLVLYGIITGESISKLLMAAIIPGILIGLSFMIGILLKAKLNPNSAPLVHEKFSWKEKFQSLKGLIGIVFIFATIFIGLFTGLFTATESAAFGALAALITLIIKGWKEGFKEKFITACVESAQLNIAIFFLILSAYVFTNFLIQAGLPQQVSATIANTGLPPIGIIFIIIATYLILGMFLESTAIILITVPIYYPIIDALGFDGVWFGIIVACMIEIGLITPPFGLIAFTIDSIAPEIGLLNVFKGAVMFLVCQLVVVVLMVFFPEIALWLPSIAR